MKEAIKIIEGRIERLKEMKKVDNGNDKHNASVAFAADIHINCLTETIKELKESL